MSIRFGINFMPGRVEESVSWCETAEREGFDVASLSDSQSICREVFMCLTLAAVRTERIRIGCRVITPLTRHPALAACAAATLDEIAPARTFVGIGSGDSAVYNIGIKPASLAELREYALAMRSLLTTGAAEYHGQRGRLTWARVRIPLYLAASGPKTLRLAGQIADGVVIRTGIVPDIIRGSITQVHQGAEEAGRDPGEIDMWWWPDVNVAGSYREAVAGITMSLAAAGNHLSRFTTEGKHIPPELLPRVKDLGARYHFDTHVTPGSANARLIAELGLVDYLADRFAVAGTPDECIKKLEQAIDAGARQIWMSAHFDDKAGFMRQWAAKVMPAFR